MLFRKAILIIHGFAGGTYDEEELANYLELNKYFDVYQFTLPGHDINLSKVKYNEWISASEKQIKWLIDKGYHNIYLIGHSMGGVIASYIATKYKEVRKLVLAAPAFQYLSVVNDTLNVKKSIGVAPKIIKTYGPNEIISRFLKLNASSIREFMSLIRHYYDCPKGIFCPILIIQGKKDDLVPVTSARYVYDNVQSKIKKIVYISSATHDIFRASNRYEVYNIIEDFFKNTTKGGIENI